MIKSDKFNKYSEYLLLSKDLADKNSVVIKKFAVYIHKLIYNITTLVCIMTLLSNSNKLDKNILNYTNNYIKKAGLPKNNSLITLSEVKYWEPRIDRVYLSKSGNFDVMKGISGYDLRVPELPPGSMPLTDIALFPYVKNKKDHRVQRANNTGYKMSQIRDLEQRIQGLEEITTLTMSELSTTTCRTRRPF